MLAFFLTLTACDKDPVDSGVTTQDLTLEFAATVGGEPVSCATAYSVGSGEATAQLADARFFISGVELQNADGEWVAMDLEQDGKWQVHDIALMDFEDGSGACADSGNADLNSQIVGSIAEGDYSGLRFVVGVPFEHNHLDNATADAPLNSPGMFWSWQGGYKFVRVDWSVQGETVLRSNMHVGSTGCTSDAATSPPTEECSNPNRATVELSGFDPETQVVSVDLAELVADLDLGADTADTPPGCMSAPSEPDDCGPIWESLGMDFSTGLCVSDCGAQSVFGAE
ncbi:MAG: MbnP family copper-binding protein [Myxococcota bacterium]|nr:MbnP family copper-binding protein [Myxococcota bacterium]